MYKAGDEFVIKIAEIFETGWKKDKLYRILGFNSLVLDEDEPNTLPIYSKDLIAEDGYNNGLNDMWEAIALITGLYHNNIEDIFGYKTLNDVTKYNSAKDFIKQLKAYEEKQKKTKKDIKVGDEIYCIMTKFHAVITHIDSRDRWQCLGERGLFTINDNVKKYWVKTGRHFNVEETLKELKGEYENGEY